MDAMPRSALSPAQVADFRETLCEAAMQLFAEHGYEGVTLRGLARELGCSAMTPYRYFENKAAIFDAVASRAAARFAGALEDSIADVSGPRERLRSLAYAYARFGLEPSQAYRIIYELDPADRSAPEPADLRSWQVMHRAVQEAIAASELAGDADVLAHLLWSGMHGIVALHLAGKLELGLDVQALVEAFVDRQLGAPREPLRVVP